VNEAKRERIAACPQCGSSTRLDSSNPWRPFCSERCKLIDLGAWLSGRYALPVTGKGDADDIAAPGAADQ
jgi:endogenous inhibitor of DNA gyrase (YacG/DUF329 family)